MTLLASFLSAADLKTMLTIIYVIVVIVAILVVVRDISDPVKALAWITVIALLPVLGIIIYTLFGRNRRKEKIFNLKEIEDLGQFEEWSRQQLEALNTHESSLRRDIADNRDIITLLLNSNKALLTVRNKITVINNGKATFASIIDALQSAEHFIHLEYYIFEDDRIGKRIGRILQEKARAGVEVRMIYDDVGSWDLSRKFIRELREAGVKVCCFMQVVFPWLTSKVNYRNHRKIVVVDGKVAYTGGINIADRYMKRGKYGIWRDTHLKLEGEAVAMLQTVFATDWFFLSNKEQLSDRKYYPPSNVSEYSPVQIASSGPDSDWATIMQAFFAAITKAQHHIYISTPYFLPNQALLTALKVAALSGIDVRVMLPSRSDSKIVWWATRSYIGEMLDAGIKVYFYMKGFNHSKLIMIDGKFSSVGTANFDNRSFEDNFEVTAIMYDRRIAEELEAYFMRDLMNSAEITADMWSQRSKKHNIYESLARLLSPLL